jgi:signal transduction histidine kinase
LVVAGLYYDGLMLTVVARTNVPTMNGAPSSVVAQPRLLRSTGFDALVAGGSTVLSCSVLIGLLDGLSTPVRALAIAVVLVHNLSLFWRRRAPRATLWVNLATGLATVAIGLPAVVLAFAPLIALYSVSSQVPRRQAVGALAAMVVALFAAEALAGWPEDPSTMAGNVLGLLAAWLLGSFVFVRQTYVEELEIRTRQLEQAREELARKVAAEERLRIARELHDVVAHSLSMIAVQSGVGAHVMDHRPEEARRALKSIEDVSRTALNEMRWLLGVMREEGGASLVPLPGVGELQSLIEQTSTDGLRVELHVHGAARPLPAGADLTAYRIVQEALTNIVRHAEASAARVVLDYAPGHIVVEVVDNGRGPARTPVGSGHGLDGMRERVQLFGGSLDAGTLRDGGFRVRAELPLEGGAG